MAVARHEGPGSVPQRCEERLIPSSPAGTCVHAQRGERKSIPIEQRTGVICYIGPCVPRFGMVCRGRPFRRREQASVRCRRDLGREPVSVRDPDRVPA